MKKFVIFIISLIAIIGHNKYQVESSTLILNFLRQTIQENLAGIPVVHKQVEFDFDPDVSQKRRSQFYQLHGFKANNLIERTGLGIDGNHEQRLKEQQDRDEGKLQGVLYVQPPQPKYTAETGYPKEK